MTSRRALSFCVAAAAVAAGVLVIATPQGADAPGKRFLNLDGVPKPNGYTHVVVSPPGRMVFVSGQGGRGDDGRMPADFSAQAENTFRNIGKCLTAAGATFADVVKVNYYVTDLAQTEEPEERDGGLQVEDPHHRVQESHTYLRQGCRRAPSPSLLDP